MKTLTLAKNRVHIWMIVMIPILILSVVVLVSYFHDQEKVNRTINSGSKIIQTPIGAIEFFTYGKGKPMLISHGAGGGFDQGILITKILGNGFQFILPSRFGYLHSKTSLPVTARLQAEAYSYILKDLGIHKVSVAAISAGGPPALSFASHYPGQCENLIMMSAKSAPIVNSKDDSSKGVAFKLLFKSNFLYWSVTKLFRPQLLSLFGLTKDDQQRLSKTDKKWNEDLIYTTMPASIREQGNLNDMKMIMPSKQEVEAIKAPTLIIHVRQDPLISFRNAEYTHQHVSGSVLIPLDHGGHFLMGHHREIAAEIRAFLK